MKLPMEPMVLTTEEPLTAEQAAEIRRKFEQGTLGNNPPIVLDQPMQAFEHIGEEVKYDDHDFEDLTVDDPKEPGGKRRVGIRCKRCGFSGYGGTRHDRCVLAPLATRKLYAGPWVPIDQPPQASTGPANEIFP